MRFSLVHHTGWSGHHDHFDLMLQFANGIDDNDLVLKTFSTELDEIRNEELKGMIVIPRPDHRRIYLDFEGPVSGSRGFVSLVDTGNLHWKLCRVENNVQKLQFCLAGKHLTGCYSILHDSDLHYVLRKE